MADIIAPILNIVSVLCSCSSNNRCCYLLDLQENKDALHTAMEELKATRDDVKRKVDVAENNPNELMQRTKEVDNWLQRAQNIEGEVGEILEKADQEIQGKCFGGNFPINCRSARKIGKLVLQKLPIVNEHRSKGSFGDVAYRLPPPSVQKEHVDSTVGMDSMFDKVWRLLAKDDVRIMGLYGYGGVGKTTLLKQINNEFLKTTTTITTSNNNNTTTSNNNLHGFDVVILVVVSQEINIDVIQKKIGDRLGLSSPNTEEIFNVLTKKNFVLLLDDIWDRVDLPSIGVPPPSENNKSKVVFTTRSEVVCGQMEANEILKVECLPWNEAWSLFEGKVGERALNSFPRARELAEVVARECGGLPLALITIGRAMAAKKTLQEWNYAITTLQRYASEFPGMGDDVLPHLKLSYDNLGDAMIKSCFLYCALFPEDHSIDKAKLIDYWIGEGLISLNEFDHIDDARNKGYHVIGILKGACLLESGRDEESEVKMHDTIRDLALWIAHDCGNKRDKMLTLSDLTAETSSSSSSSWYNNAERIYLNISSKIPQSHHSNPLKSPKLITLIIHVHSGNLSQNYFSFMPLLRVLDLSYTQMKTFPTNITELFELEHLSLSSTSIRELPVELGNLVKLKHLDLSYMMRLKKIPSGVIGNLVELRVLNLFRSPLDWDFDELYKLKHLNDLEININTQHNLDKLLSNQSLRMCTRRLKLFSSTTTIGGGAYKKKKNIRRRSLQKKKTLGGGGGGNMKSLEKLELLSNLETLLLESLPELMKVNMGVWENHYNYMSQEAPFQNLGQIIIEDCNALKDITWVGYVPNLKTLHVNHCVELEEIVRVVVDDFGGSTRGGEEGDEISMVMNNVEDVFKRLKRLTIINLPKLKRICRNALAFPCLETMLVLGCPQLKKLPLDFGSNLNNTLQMIGGEEEWWNELRWEEDDDNNELLKSKFLPYFDKIGVC